ncbi:MAG TPA: selenoneine biosynthesis selenosugar synthase SenB [Burkholderiales bacterium]|nr:selenoneine biosynthesis selenosugar synthase SenB [Burkholderiales bacterium]HSA70799.1 selenoneine biosynthesis selenosugar synthase SenB [Burkholderiales bacterium]
MRIALVTPAGPGTRNGNRHTALRWAVFLRQAGHRVSVSVQWSGDACDAMLALHAGRSHASIRSFPRNKPLVVALTGTDVYRDIHESADARESLELAHRLIVLQPKAADELPARLRRKVRVVVQSSSTRLRQRPVNGGFRVCVIGHLRVEKDPLRMLSALELIPQSFRLQVIHLGAALDPALVPKSEDPRYRWLGSVPHARALKWLASSHAMVITSRMEGGANVVCEALRIGVPVLASRISGNVGLLGALYAGYFPVEDEHALARLVRRAATDPAYYRTLKNQIAPLRKSVSPQAEARALLAVMRDATATRG